MPQIEALEATDHDARDLEALAARAKLEPLGLGQAPDDAALDEAAMELRRRWLAAAHGPADTTLKSPCDGASTRLPHGETVRFGYERELDASVLETRGRAGEDDFLTPAGWRATRVVCRSGQAALSCLLHLVTSLNGKAGALGVHHAGRYFETRALLGLWPRHTLRTLPATEPAVDLLVAEPVFCDGAFGITDPTVLPRARRALLLDTTLVGAKVDLAPWFARVDGPMVAVFRSGLKLDQAGLELANVGIIYLFIREGCDGDSVAEALRRVRALTGSGLTLDEMAALSAPWFLDAGYLRRYAEKVFANNVALAHAIGDNSAVFEAGCHPVLFRNDAVAPFCAIRPRGGDLGAHRKILAKVEHEIERRELRVTRGGSFGFRGPRYEPIEPAPEEGRPFLRVAMGFRSSAATQGLIDILQEMAAGSP